MIKFVTLGFEDIAPEHSISRAEVDGLNGRLGGYIDSIESKNLGFYKTIDNQDLVKDIEDYAAEIEGQFDDIAVCAIGGSSLGTICLQQSLTHLYENELPGRNRPRLHVLDNIDPELLAAFEDIVDIRKTLFIVVTKSGGTPETLSQFMYFRKRVLEVGGTLEDQFVFITDPEKGLLRQIANNNERIKTFPVPQDVGGRFSVLTAVGLLPAKLMGVDIRGLLEGARAMRDQFLNRNVLENMPFRLAEVQFLMEQKGKRINVMYSYAQKLIRFSDWYRQLLAESIGKAVNNNGETVNVGITPVFALGATDQHSQNQLYNEGPNDKFFIFLAAHESARDIDIPFDDQFADSIGYLKNVSFNRLLKTEMRGTVDALAKYNRPSVELWVEKVDEYNLGELFMLFEGATAFLGEFYNINAFDQPGVELAKQLTKEYLTEQ